MTHCTVLANTVTIPVVLWGKRGTAALLPLVPLATPTISVLTGRSVQHTLVLPKYLLTLMMVAKPRASTKARVKSRTKVRARTTDSVWARSPVGTVAGSIARRGEPWEDQTVQASISGKQAGHVWWDKAGHMQS